MPWNKCARVLQILSLCPRARKPQLPSPRAAVTKTHVPWSPWSTREATAARNPRIATREQPPLAVTKASPLPAMKTQHGRKQIHK